MCRKTVGLLGLLVALVCGVALGNGVALAQESSRSTSTTDHSKLEPLMREFSSGPEVTAACLSCHTEAGEQVMHSIHYSWDYAHPATGQDLGKRRVLNNFCGNVVSNEARCTSCHTGYGWEDMRVEAPPDPTRVDCLACHDGSGQYTKLNNQAGHPPLDPVPAGARTITGAEAWAVDLTKAAQSVGPPTRQTCGTCHFYGGGGDNVKHGDLSSVLYDPPRSVDVHMSVDGGDFSCSTCHVSDGHQIAGSRYSVDAKPSGERARSVERRDVATCESCHSGQPHAATLVGNKLDNHSDRIACQTCHVPEFARGGVATQTLWDWSTSGRLENGRPLTEMGYVQGDGTPRPMYQSPKGDLDWAEDVVPEYHWFDGQVRYETELTDVTPGEAAVINPIAGDPTDGLSRIWPFKRMEGRQPYDTHYHTLLLNQVYGPGSETAYWIHYDWDKSLRAAMDYVGEPFSGEWDFIDTHMYWPVTHMVAPAEDALDCQACHTRDGRMVGLAGVYVPGADGLGTAGIAGLVLLILTVLGVAGHAAARFISTRKGGQHG